MGWGIPVDQGAGLTLVAQNAEAAGTQHQSGAAGGALPQPAPREAAQDVAMGKERHVTALPWCTAGVRAGTGDHPLTALLHLIAALSPWAGVAEDGPVRDALANHGGGQPLVVAVVPFLEIGFDLGLLAQAGQFTGASGPLQGAA